MKKELLSIIFLLVMTGLNGQNIKPEAGPKGMVFVPAGSFQMNMTWDSKPRTVNVTVEAFWMSNEITNSEYREFVDWAKKNPEEKLYQVKYSREVVADPVKNTMKDTLIRKITIIEVPSLSPEMIDTLCLERINKEYKGYFTDKKYKDYPVVGVSSKMAEYYCLWKTMTENQKQKEKGLPDVHAYRLPLEAEWAYAANQPVAKVIQPEGKADFLIQKVNEGDSNYLGLSHLDNNVSEWVLPSPGGKERIIRGGSWKSGSNISERQVTDPDCKEASIGFRIVQSYKPLPPSNK